MEGKGLMVDPRTKYDIIGHNRQQQKWEGRGTDEKAIIWILGHRNADQRKQIKLAYQEIYLEDRNKKLKSELSGEFERMESLLLSWNDLNGSLPNCIGQLSQLKELIAYFNQLQGSIPSSFGNFCNLQYLDLSFNNLNESLPEIINGTETCNSKSPLPNLRELYLEYNQLMGKLPNWLSELKHLEELDISHNQLQGSIPSSIGNFCNLQYLDLSDNNLNGSLPEIIYGTETWNSKSPLPNLRELDLFHNQLMGKLPNWLGELKNLRRLELSNNKLEGPIPTSLCTLQRMESLSLGWNELNGSLPNCIGQLSQLKELSVYSNQLSETLFEEHFLKLSNLESLDLDNFRLNVSSNWVPPFKLRSLNMGSCHIGPAFPVWLQSQKNLQYLYLSNASISSSIPNWFWNISSNLELLILSHNQLQGSISGSIGNFCNLQYLDLSNNNLNGSLPEIINGTETCNSKSPLPNLRTLYLKHNQLMGRLPNWLGELKHLEWLDLYDNQLQGSIPSSIGNFCNLQYLDLSNNNLNGSLPEIVDGTETCNSKSPLPNLRELYLSDNQLMGKLPNWLGELKNLEQLDLSNNQLQEIGEEEAKGEQVIPESMLKKQKRNE